MPSIQDPDFLNGAARIDKPIEPLPLRKLLRTIEAELGRVRSGRRYAPRTLDLDISLMGTRIVNKTPITLPDPDITQHAFLAIPLAELAPNALHPLEKISLSQIAARFGKHPEGLAIDQKTTSMLQAIFGGANPL